MKTLLGATALTVVLAGSAHAAGTEAGTPVENTFTLTYDVNDTAQQAIDTSGDLPGTTADPTTFVVDRFIDLTVSSEGNTAVAPGQTGAELVFQLVNEGNGDQSYNFDIEDQTGDGFDPNTYVITYFRDTDDDGAFDPAIDTTSFVGNTAFATVKPDEVIWVVVEATIPTVGGSATADDAFSFDAELGTISLKATTTNDGTGTVTTAESGTDTNDLSIEENIFGDAVGTHADDAVVDGEHSAVASYEVVASVITGTKDVYILADNVDVAAGAAATTCQDMGTVLTAVPAADDEYSLPGACVEYIIAAAAAGSGTPENIDISDILPDDLIFQGASTSGFATAPTLTAPAVPTVCTAGACTVSAADGELAAGATGYLHIRALIQ